MQLLLIAALLFTAWICPAHAGTPLFAGGVYGFSSLATKLNSDEYRQAGGGLYIHNNGWMDSLTGSQRRRIRFLFRKKPVALELGFGRELGHAQAWANLLRDEYLSRGFQPTFIASNAFDSNQLPTPDMWNQYTATLRSVGLPAWTQIYPTFEYANYQGGADLAANKVSLRGDFQAIVTSAGGIVLDAPPQFFFDREQEYRDWMLDAIIWCRQRSLQVVWIASPHNSGYQFSAHVNQFLQYFQGLGWMPSIIVVENYVVQPAADYPNFVGAEDQPETVMGVARMLQLQGT